MYFQKKKRLNNNNNDNKINEDNNNNTYNEKMCKEKTDNSFTLAISL